MYDTSKQKAIEDYWQRRLSGDLPKILLPGIPGTTGSEDEMEGKSRDQLSFDFPTSAVKRLEAISGSSDTALFILVFTAFNIILNRYTGIDDLVVGTVTPRKEDRKSNLVLCRNGFSGELTFKEMVNRVKQVVLADFNHADYVFGLIYQKLVQDASDSFDVFNVAFIYDCFQDNIKALGQFDAVFILSGSEEKPGQLSLQVNYNTGRYSEEIIRRFCMNLVHIFESDPVAFDRPLSQLEIVSPGEQEEMQAFNRTETPYPGQKTIQQLFEEQVQRTPEMTAIVETGIHDSGVRRMSYRELNEQANRLAAVLREKGVTPDSVVGIMEKRSIEMVVEMLAVLKAGGAYLPIDPAAPKNRVTAMLDECNVSLLISRSGIIKNYSYSALQGLRKTGTQPVYTTPRKQITDLNTLPIPDRSMVNYEKYNQYIGQVMVKNIISLQTARGCPFNCAYCSEIWPPKHVFRSAENIFKELKLYYDMGIRRFSIFDDIFNVNKENGKRLFRKIIDSKLDVQLFFPNGMRGDLLDKEYIDLAVEAGLCATAMALETASPRLQKMIRKNLNLEKFKENIEYFCQKYPQVILELFTMHGFPSETEEEAKMTMGFIKSLKWVHFPYVFILKIYPGTEMADLAMQHGVYREDILRCEDMAFHELSPTSPFDIQFTRQYQSDFLNGYFLSKERLLHVLPYQAKVLTRDEIVQKYDSYLPFKVERFEDILDMAGISEDELKIEEFRAEENFHVPDLNVKLRAHFPEHKPAGDALRVLFLDVSQYFSGDTDMLYDVVEPPLGAMYIMTYLKEQLGDKVNVRIARSRMDFDSYDELQVLLEEFRPDVIGMRTLTFYRDFFHQVAARIRQWGFSGPIIAGGPYATRNTDTLIQDKNIDLLVTSEGEWTFRDVIGKILENSGRLPSEEVLRTIPGIVFLPSTARGARQLLLVDTMGKTLAQKPGENPESVNQSSDIAYVIFTSGSTGKPKGVAVEHRNVVNVLTWFGKTYNLQPGIRVSQLNNYTFDPSVEQVFGTLFYGGELYLGPPQLTVDKDAFREFVNQHQIQVVNFFPGALKHLVGENERLPSISVLISGAEKLEEDLKNRLLAKGYNLYNHYGPTETTIEVLTAKCSQAKVTLGRPIANTQCYVLSPGHTLAPVGVKGELFIGGAGVSRGYLNNPELTSERFTPGTKLYKTGDFARWLPDGTVEFLGRIDQQLKIRGLRIELGEIETLLQSHGKIKEVVVNPVTIGGEDSGEEAETNLCAYFTSDLELTPGELRDYLSMELPTYMIPSYFIKIDKMPVNVNGKVDRNALPNPESSGTGGAAEYVPPKSETEKILVDVWADVLGKERVGINDNFFSLGGDSVKSIQILSQLSKTGYKVEMIDIFQYPTISQLAPLVKTVERRASQSAVEGILPLTPVQIDFFLRHKTAIHHFNQALMLFTSDNIDEAEVREIFTRLQAHHDALRLTFKVGEDGSVIQTNRGLDLPLSLEVVDLRGTAGTRAAAVSALREKADALQASIYLEQGPLMKLGLFHLDDGSRLLIVIHHLAVDAVSWRILLEDIETLHAQYKNFKRGKALELPLKSDSFKTWSESLSQYAVNEFLMEEKEWWKELENTEIPPLPLDSPAPGEKRNPIKIKNIRKLTVSLDETETRRLLTDVNKAFGTEINDILLTALGLALKETFGSERYLIALEGHGREEILEQVDITRTVGWFTSLFPVVLDISRFWDPALLVKEIKDYLHRVPNKGIGYGILRYLTPPEHKEDLQFRHEPRISFNYLGQVDAGAGEGAFRIASESPGRSISEESEQEYLLEISGIVSRNCLSISVQYNDTQYKTETVENFINHYKLKLVEVISFCSEWAERELTPSDMDYKELSVEELDSIFD